MAVITRSSAGMASLRDRVRAACAVAGARAGSPGSASSDALNVLLFFAAYKLDHRASPSSRTT